MKEIQARFYNRSKSKALFLTLLLFLFTYGLYAQVTIGDGTPPQTFSTLEVVSKGKGGMRLPHLTTAERDALSATANFNKENHRGSSAINPGLALGLTIYNTDSNCTEYWNGYKWISLCLGTASIQLESPCGNYDSKNPPIATADGNNPICQYTPVDKPTCIVPSGKAYDVYLTAGSAYARLVVDQVTSKFTITFQPNNSSFIRNAVVRVVNNCSGEFKDFVFSQAGSICPPGSSDPILNSTALNLCSNGSVFANVINAQNGIDYLWTFGGVIIHTGSWYEIKRAGVYQVYAGLLGCGNPATLNVINNSNNNAPTAITISATNGGILCSGGNVVLTASTSQSVLWYHNGIPLTGTNKNDNPLTLSGGTNAGNWFAAVQEGTCVSNSSNVLSLTDNTSSSTALPAPIATINGQALSGDIVICKSGTLKLEVTNAKDYPSGTIYEWFNNGLSIGKGTNPIIYLVSPYTDTAILSVMAYDQSGSCPNASTSKKISVIFTAPSSPNINNGATQAAICGGTPATLIAGHTTGATEYEWMKEGITMIGKNTNIITASEPGTYTVRYKNAQGCWSPVSTEISVMQSAPLSMNWNIIPTDVVKGEIVTYSVISSPKASQYKWEIMGPQGAVTSVNPIGDGSSVVVVYGNPTADKTLVSITVKSVNHPCGDVTLAQNIYIKSGCVKATSVNLTPNGEVPVLTGQTQKFVAGTNGSAEGLIYQWYIDGVIQPTTSPNLEYTSDQEGEHSLMVRVLNSCTTAGDNITAAATIIVKKNSNDTPSDDSGDYQIRGKDCFDVGQSNFNSTCGLADTRHNDFAVDNDYFTPNARWVYTFTPGTNAPYSDLRFDIDDPNGLIKRYIQVIPRKSVIIIFKDNIIDRARGKDKNNALSFTIYALYQVNGQMKHVKLSPKIQDCSCGCGAFIARGIWRNFLCYNLGANKSLTPSVPAAGIHGAKYKFGASNATVSMQEDQSRRGTIDNWGGLPYQTTGSWLAENNPCPADYRIPTASEWRAVINNNTPIITDEETWGEDFYRYSSGMRLGNLFLPAAGKRSGIDGFLSKRNQNGQYWSSTPSPTSLNKALYFETGFDAGNPHWSDGGGLGYRAELVEELRAAALSVRCIESK